MLDYIVGGYLFLNLYNQVNLFLIKRRAKKPVDLMHGAEPFYHKGGKKGVLLIHGYSATPSEMRGLGNYLSKKKYTVYAPLLPGHGTSPEKLTLIKWDDWVNAIHQGIKLLENDCDKIYLVGNSFGGNLAILNGHNKSVKGLVLLGTPIYFKHHNFYRALFMIIKRIKLFQRKKYSKEILEKGILDRRVAYSLLPLKSLNHVLKIIQKSKKCLPISDKPVLIMQSLTDEVVDSSSVSFLYSNVTKGKRKVVWVPDAYHVFIVDSLKELEFEEIHKFIKNN